MIQQAYNIFDSFLKIDEANRKYAGAHQLGEKPENRIGASTRAALSAAKLRAGESGLSDEERAMRQGQLANMETGLGFTTDYNQLYGAYDKAGIDPGSTGQNAAQGVGTANALAGMRYEGSGEQLAKETAAQSDRIFQNFTSIMDMGMGAGGQAGAPSGNFQDAGPVTIDNNFGMSTPDYGSVYNSANVIDNNYGMSTPQAGIPDYLSNPAPEVQSTNQQDIVSMLLNLLNKNKPRA